MQNIVINSHIQAIKHINIGIDLDHTIIKPNSGNKLPKNVDDWDWWDKVVPNKLIELCNQKVRFL